MLDGEFSNAAFKQNRELLKEMNAWQDADVDQYLSQVGEILSYRRKTKEQEGGGGERSHDSGYDVDVSVLKELVGVDGGHLLQKALKGT